MPFFALRLIQMQVERDVERNAYRGGDGGAARPILVRLAFG